MRRHTIDGLISIVAGMVWWVFKGTIEATFFEQVAKQVNAFDSLIVEYGVPLGFGIYGIWLLLKKSDVKTEPTQTAPAQGESFVPIHQAIAHVARVTNDKNDNDRDKFFPETRTALRQASVIGKLRIRGCREVAGPNVHQSYFDDVQADIPSDYWATAVIGPIATDPNYTGTGHTMPKVANDWGPDWTKAKKQFANLHVNRDDLLKLWPKDLATTQNKFIPLQMAAMDVYNKAKAKDHFWYHVINKQGPNTAFGINREDGLLNCTASLMAAKVRVFGKTDFATERELIEHAGERNSTFWDKATKFKFLLDERKRVWTDLAVTLDDLAALLKYIDDGLTGSRGI